MVEFEPSAFPAGPYIGEGGRVVSGHLAVVSQVRLEGFEVFGLVNSTCNEVVKLPPGACCWALNKFLSGEGEGGGAPC
jgi:hypothetical protein